MDDPDRAWAPNNDRENDVAINPEPDPDELTWEGLDDPNMGTYTDMEYASDKNPEPNPVVLLDRVPCSAPSLKLATEYAQWEPRRLYPNLFRDKTEQGRMNQEHVQNFFNSMLIMNDVPRNIIRELLAANCQFAGANEDCPFEDFHGTQSFQFIDKEKAWRLMDNEGSEIVGMFPVRDTNQAFYIYITPTPTQEPSYRSPQLQMDSTGNMNMESSFTRKESQSKKGRKHNRESKSKTRLTRLVSNQEDKATDKELNYNHKRRKGNIRGHRDHNPVNKSASQYQVNLGQVRRSPRQSLGKLSENLWWILNP